MINKIDLSGEWRLRLDKEKKGIERNFLSSAPEDSIVLPSTTSASCKGEANPEECAAYLTDKYAFEGWAWYYKKVSIGRQAEGKRLTLRLERTRMTTLWVNGSRIGSCDSLCTPHIYDITDFSDCDELDICILVSNTDYPTKGGHMTSPDTQSNWNGITGELALEISERSGIRSVQAYPDVLAKSVTLRFETEGIGDTEINIWGASSDGKVIDCRGYHLSADDPEVQVFLGEDASLWNEHDPVTYTLKAALPGSADIATVTFGLREIRTEGLDIRVNGEKVFLRGKHDGMVFPLTGAAPTTVNEWYEVLSKAKDWGMNHYRFHTCCPPDAAFTAADMLGIYMQPELPFWGTIHAPDDEDFNGTEQEYLIEEGRRILKAFGNHPSFVMMSLGNELWGSTKRLDGILKEYRELDPRHIYIQGSNNFQFYPNIQPHDDFFSGVRLSRERLIRGSYANCDAPLGFVQTEQPNTVHSYDSLIFPDTSESSGGDDAQEIEIQFGTGVKKVRTGGSGGGLIPDKPVITHEVGQYCTYPDFDERKKYTGVLDARYLDIFRRRLENKGMLSYAADIHRASGMLAFNCYKLEIEAAMRSEYISGFQLLDLQDFPGQCIALVGMLDPFMEEKSFVSEFGLRKKWRGFCSDIVILAEISSFVVTVGEELRIPVSIRNMSGRPLIGKRLCWSTDEEQESIDIPDGLDGRGRVGEIAFTVPYSGHIGLDMYIIDRDGEITDEKLAWNFYDLWAVRSCEVQLSGKVTGSGNTAFITSDRDEAARLLENGGRVLYLPEKCEDSVKGFYCTDFWCYPMFRSISESMGREVPVGTMGLLIDKEHPALAGFPTEFYSTPQWYHIVSHADCAVLDGTDEKFHPIVQMTDNFERNHKLGILFEARVGEGRLLVCTSRLNEISDCPEAQQFAKSLTDYILSESFMPACEFAADEILK